MEVKACDDAWHGGSMHFKLITSPIRKQQKFLNMKMTIKVNGLFTPPNTEHAPQIDF